MLFFSVSDSLSEKLIYAYRFYQRKINGNVLNKNNYHRYYRHNLIQRLSLLQYLNKNKEKNRTCSNIGRAQTHYNYHTTLTATHALGKQSTYHFTQFSGEYKITQVEGHPSANCAAANQAYTYDDNGFMASSTDWQGNITLIFIMIAARNYPEPRPAAPRTHAPLPLNGIWNLIYPQELLSQSEKLSWLTVQMDDC